MFGRKERRATHSWVASLPLPLSFSFPLGALDYSLDYSRLLATTLDYYLRPVRHHRFYSPTKAD